MITGHMAAGTCTGPTILICRADVEPRMRLSLIPAARLVLATLFCQILLSAPASAGNAPTNSDKERFKWVSRADALRDDLSRGYDIVYGARVREWLLLERQADGRSMFDYLVLSPTTLSRFQDAVNAAVSKG